MTKKKPPENIEWIARGRVTFSGATCIVHAKTRAEALLKANAGANIGGIDNDTAETVDWDFVSAEPNVADD